MLTCTSCSAPSPSGLPLVDDSLTDVPAEPWNAAGAIGMLAVAVALAAAGCLRYARRDLRT